MTARKIITHKYYEILVCILALSTIIITLMDLTGVVNLQTMPLFHYIDTGIWIFFIFDYVIRFIYADNKAKFVKNNIFDLIAIIPFEASLSLFRTVRLVKVVRLSKISKLAKFIKFAAFATKFKKFLYTNGFIYVLYANIITIILGSIGIYSVEQGTTVKSLPDAVWWAFVTATTVGYGDISPSTNAGRLIAGVLMVVGIAFVSMLTGTIATYFTNRFNHNGEETLSSSDIAKIKEILERLEDKNEL